MDSGTCLCIRFSLISSQGYRETSGYSNSIFLLKWGLLVVFRILFQSCMLKEFYAMACEKFESENMLARLLSN